MLLYVSPFSSELFPSLLPPDALFLEKVTVTFLLRSYTFSLLVIPFLFNETLILLRVFESPPKVIEEPSAALLLEVIALIFLLSFLETAYFSASKGSKLKLEISVISLVEMVICFPEGVPVTILVILNSESLKSTLDTFLFARGTNKFPEPLTIGAPTNIDTVIFSLGVSPM